MAWKMGWVLLRCWCSCANVPKALLVSYESADTCISAMAFNAIVAELFWFVEITSSNTNNIKEWRETFGVEDAWTVTAREWTILDNPIPTELKVKKGMRADVKLCGLADCKCVIWGLANCQGQVCILICHGGCMWQSTGIEIDCCWHLPNLEIVICKSNWVIDLLFNTRLICKRLRLWFLSWYSPRVWEFVKSFILLGSSESCFGSLYATCVLAGSIVGSFVGFPIGSTNWIKWFTRARFPAAELRFIKASPEFFERKIVKSTKNMERAVIAFNPFRFRCFILFLCSRCSICLCNLAKTWVW